MTEQNDGRPNPTTDTSTHAYTPLTELDGYDIRANTVEMGAIQIDEGAIVDVAYRIDGIEEPVIIREELEESLYIRPVRFLYTAESEGERTDLIVPDTDPRANKGIFTITTIDGAQAHREASYISENSDDGEQDERVIFNRGFARNADSGIQTSFVEAPHRRRILEGRGIDPDKVKRVTIATRVTPRPPAY